MTHLETGLRELHRGEHRLASLLDALAERHRDDADLRCVGRDLYTASGSPGLVLLGDLRLLYRAAAGVVLDWDVLAQTATALGNRGLLALTESCRPGTVRQMRWAEAALKESAAQIMLSE